MHFKVNKEILQPKLAAVKRILTGRAIYPALNSIMVETTETGISLTTTDMEMSIKVCLPALVETPGTACITAKQFVDLVARLSGELDISVDDSVATINYTGGHAKIGIINPDEYPPIPIVEGQKMNVPSESWKKAMARVVFCAAPFEVRPSYSGVLIAVTPEKLTMVATDTYRMALDALNNDTSDPWDDARLFIPSRLLAEVNQNVSAGGVLTIEWKDNECQFSMADFVITGRLMDATFPEYQKVIPKASDTPFVCNRDILLSTLQRASLFYEAIGGNAVVEIKTGNSMFNTMEIKADGAMGSLRETIDLDNPVPDITQSFTAKYLLESLPFLSEKVSLSLDGNLLPGVFREGEYLYLVLPVRRVSKVTAETTA
jgi:DNA polymerase-3 subunit beta